MNNEPCDINRTYNGYTNNPKRRIRQHNQEIKKGAVYTKKYGNKTWEYLILIGGLPDKKNALQCEWKIKHPDNKKRGSKYTGPKGRIKGLIKILKEEKWTNPTTVLTKDINLTLWIKDEFYDLFGEFENVENIKLVKVDNFGELLEDL